MKSLTFALVLILISICSYAQWEINGSKIYYNGGNVGIGTSTPSTNLEIIKDNTDEDGDIRDAVISIQNNNYSRYRAVAYSNTFFRNAQIQGIRGRGTMENPQNLLPGDRVFGVYGNIIEDGEINFSPIASMEYYVGNTVGSGEITFMTLNPNNQIREERLRINAYGNVGIGTIEPLAKLHIAEGDIYISDINRGIIMKSPDGNCWKGTLDNDGVLNFVLIDCLELITETNSPHDSFLNDISVFPNPTENHISITFNEKKYKKLHYTIHDVNGRLIQKGVVRLTNENINISHLINGIYFMSIHDKYGNKLTSEKIIKN